jgi:hypothetical protein
MKRLWISCEGQLYIQRAFDQRMVRLLSCNMSWMPDFFWKRLLKLTAPKRNKKNLAENKKFLKEVNLDLPWNLRIRKICSRF